MRELPAYWNHYYGGLYKAEFEVETGLAHERLLLLCRIGGQLVADGRLSRRDILRLEQSVELHLDCGMRRHHVLRELLGLGITRMRQRKLTSVDLSEVDARGDARDLPIGQRSVWRCHRKGRLRLGRLEARRQSGLSGGGCGIGRRCGRCRSCDWGVVIRSGAARQERTSGGRKTSV